MILDVVPGSPATEAGLLVGDVITGAAKGTNVMPSGWSWSALSIADLVKVIEASDNGLMTLLVRRAGNTLPLTLTPRPSRTSEQPIGRNDVSSAAGANESQHRDKFGAAFFNQGSDRDQSAAGVQRRVFTNRQGSGHSVGSAASHRGF